MTVQGKGFGFLFEMLEIYGGPFDDDDEAIRMHQQAALDCGWAGPAFVERIIGMDERQIVDDYERMLDFVRAISGGKNGAHAAGVSAVALADSMIDQWFFGGSESSAWETAQRMAVDILINQVEENSMDVNENAVQFIVDWVLSNKAYFGPNTVGTCLGFTSESGNTVYIFPSMLNQALTKAGYSSPRKIVKYLAEQGLIDVDIDKKTGKKVNSVLRRFNDRKARFVGFRIGRITEKKDPIDDIDELNNPDHLGNYDYPQEQFPEISDEECGDLPF